MYAGMKVNFHEVVKTRTAAASTESLPLFMCAFSSDKGTEEITDYSASEFFAMYGKNADFFKYGQPLIQAHAILKAGGRVLGKRLVAQDALLANNILFGEVTPKVVDKVDAEGNKLYLDADGNETTEVTDTPATIQTAEIKYTIQTVSNAKKFSDVVEEAKKAATDSKFPIVIIADNGRGVSVKKFKIEANYTVSKSLSFCMYNLYAMENTESIETTQFSINPSAKYAYASGQQKSMNLIENSTVQLKTLTVDTGIVAMVKKLAEISGYSEEVLLANDILFGCTVKGTPLENITIDDAGVVLNHQYGISLLSGSNGTFNDAPFPGTQATEAWTEEAVRYFNGDITDEIWDYELHKVDFIFDCNYPDKVKRKIEYLVGWRQDCYFFRDLGLDIWSLDDVSNKVSSDEWTKSPFVGDYLSTYEIIDAYSKKQIRVSMCHGMAPLMVQHYATNIAAPMAGIFNGFTITEAIAGTINFSPRITPKVDQLTILDDMHVNFVNYVNNNATFVVQSLFTSQDHKGPLLFASNVIVTQMAVKAVRRYTPKIRFQLMDTSDYSTLKKLIEDNCLNAFTKYFTSIKLVYTKDPAMSAEKTFHAALDCYYKEFAQGELFDVYAIDGTPDDDASSYTTSVIDL